MGVAKPASAAADDEDLDDASSAEGSLSDSDARTPSDLRVPHVRAKAHKHTSKDKEALRTGDDSTTAHSRKRAAAGVAVEAAAGVHAGGKRLHKHKKVAQQ